MGRQLGAMEPAWHPRDTPQKRVFRYNVPDFVFSSRGSSTSSPRSVRPRNSLSADLIGRVLEDRLVIADRLGDAHVLANRLAGDAVVVLGEQRDRLTALAVAGVVERRQDRPHADRIALPLHLLDGREMLAGAV